MSYHVDCLYAAVSVLAGHGHIKQRLITAYEEHLAAIRDDELPLAVQETFADLRLQLHQVSPLNGEGPIRATVRKLSIQEASACAQAVLDIYREVARRGRDRGGEMTVEQGGDEPVPPFLVKSV